MHICQVIPDNARVEQRPGGASVRTPGSPRSGAEGESGVSAQVAHSPRSEAEGGTMLICIRYNILNADMSVRIKHQRKTIIITVTS